MRWHHGTSVRRRVPRLAAALALFAVLSAGACTTARNSLGTSAGPCFRGLAAATAAVGHRGRLVGLRRMEAPRLAHRLPTATSLPRREACVFAFRGSWQASEVQKPRGQPSGRYALVVVSSRQGRVVATFLTDVLPGRFGHL